MVADWLWEPFKAWLARKRWERLRYEAATLLLQQAVESDPRSSQGPWRQNESASPVEEDPDANDWRPALFDGKADCRWDADTLRAKARDLADHNPYARNILQLHRDYVIGTGMRHEVQIRRDVGEPGEESEADADVRVRAEQLWRVFLERNDWHAGNRKDWEFCLRTWRDGECFLRLFRQPQWPPRIHFVDPERVVPDPRTGLPTGGIETLPENVEVPVAYWIAQGDASACSDGEPAGLERVEAGLILHAKIGVDANVKRGVTLLLPVLEALKRFQGWLDVELIHRKAVSSICLVRKHRDHYPAGIADFADATATSPTSGPRPRELRIEPGSIIDVQGYDLEFLSPNTHFSDASLLGRTILLSIAAGSGLPEFMLSADASNGNYASTLVAEGPAVRRFAAWQSYFIGHWQKLFRMAMAEAVRLGLLTADQIERLELRITPPPLAVRDRYADALADAVYFDRGAISLQELARRDRVDPQQMRREREQEKKP
jgi:capsid protein